MNVFKALAIKWLVIAAVVQGLRKAAQRDV